MPPEDECYARAPHNPEGEHNDQRPPWAEVPAAGRALGDVLDELREGLEGSTLSAGMKSPYRRRSRQTNTAMCVVAAILVGLAVYAIAKGGASGRSSVSPSAFRDVSACTRPCRPR
jgi:hypothetical protein